MLFLAVTAGFFAENIRKHPVEHERAKVFAENMLNDLKADTAIGRTEIIRMCKALILLSDQSVFADQG